MCRSCVVVLCDELFCSCVIALERTGAVGSAPALDFCLEHVNDDFAGDPHSPAPSPVPAAATAAVSQPSSSANRPRPPLSTVDAPDVQISINSASSSVERSVMHQVADAIFSATAQTAAAPLRALSASLSFKRDASLARFASSAPLPLSRPISEHVEAATVVADEVVASDTRRTRSAPAAVTASDSRPNASASATELQVTRGSSVQDDARAASGTLQRLTSAGRAAVAAVSGVFIAPPPFGCVICSDDYPIELRCALPCNKQTCSDM